MLCEELQQAAPIRELESADLDELAPELWQSDTPWVLRGAVKHWPAVSAAAKSDADLCQYLKQFYRDATVDYFTAPAALNGRYFYTQDLADVNFTRGQNKFSLILDQLQSMAAEEGADSLYVGSTSTATCLPGFSQANNLDVPGQQPLTTLWIGNQSRIAAHYDFPDNIACVVSGKRRFTLFPPQQVKNLYVGPLDFTPAGQSISLVDFHQPDFTRFPKFREAISQAQVSELNPGDAIFIPSMWWHHVEGLGSLNMLVNYWWRRSPAYLGPPLNVLFHGLLSLRDLPAAERSAWKALFEHYIFDADTDTAGHIPPQRQGVLAPMDEDNARRMRAILLNKLKR